MGEAKGVSVGRGGWEAVGVGVSVHVGGSVGRTSGATDVLYGSSVGGIGEDVEVGMGVVVQAAHKKSTTNVTAFVVLRANRIRVSGAFPKTAFRTCPQALNIVTEAHVDQQGE